MFSVVIPVLNEAIRLKSLLTALADQTEPPEVIVVDGGSEDTSRSLARSMGVRVIDAPRGRGQQLAAGVGCARGDILLFLHADTRLPTEALQAMQQMLDTNPEAPGGNFRLLPDRLARLYDNERRRERRTAPRTDS